jgi:hypothetical protein
MAAQEGNISIGFASGFKGREDPDPAKKAQGGRWHASESESDSLVRNDGTRAARRVGYRGSTRYLGGEFRSYIADASCLERMRLT